MILVVSICKEKLSELEFVKPIEDVLKKRRIQFFTKHYSNLKDSDLKKSSKIIICGTSLKDNDFLKDAKKFEWLKSYTKPVLGICGGSHIIGIILGYKKKKNLEIGMKKIKLNKKFLGIEGEINAYFLHQFQYLPEIFHKDNFYAVLFHPEVRNKGVIVNFSKL